jgi:hypothetical protein
MGIVASGRYSERQICFLEFSMKVMIDLQRRRQGSWLQRNYIYLLGVLALVFSIFVVGLVFVHFQFGFDIPGLTIINHDTAQYWGQIGDFVGGILNPVLSFCALIAVLYNLSLQREELALARKDARDAQEIQNKQSAIFKQQNFESVFFRLLEVHASLSRNIKVRSVIEGKSVVYVGEDAFKFLEKQYIGFGGTLRVNPLIPIETQVWHIREGSQNLLDQHVGSIGHYFRNMYQILKYVDGFGQAPAGSPRKAPRAMEVRRAMRSYRSQRDYANMLRAQLSSSEVSCLFLNCLASQGEGLKYYVEKYSMLKTLELDVIGGNQNIVNLYSRLAYADYEDLEMPEVLSHILGRFKESDI